MNELETLLQASIDLAQLRAQNKALREENERLRARLDRRMDEYNDDNVSYLLKPQAG